eukprot:scaffold70714_cov65-Phaeocystis_antarctica.AAC.7
MYHEGRADSGGTRILPAIGRGATESTTDLRRGAPGEGACQAAIGDARSSLAARSPLAPQKRTGCACNVIRERLSSRFAAADFLSAGQSMFGAQSKSWVPLAGREV